MNVRSDQQTQGHIGISLGTDAPSSREEVAMSCRDVESWWNKTNDCHWAGSWELEAESLWCWKSGSETGVRLEGGKSSVNRTSEKKSGSTAMRKRGLTPWRFIN